MNEKGFSLIEVMMAIVIVSICASFSMVTYQSITLKAHQATAKLDLINLANSVEEFFSHHPRYSKLNLTELAFKPITKEYEIKISSVSERYFRLAAIPKVHNNEDACGIFYLDQDGNQSVSGVGQDCW